ncbi:amidase family protein, partial [Kingella kingae]
FGNLDEMYSNTRAEGFGSEVKRRIMIGTYVLSHGYYDAYYLKAQKLRRLVANDFQAAFAKCDVILAPNAPTAAPALNSLNQDPVQAYLSDIYTIAVNLAGLPALSLPAGMGADGLPIGVQLIGNYFSEAKILSAAHQMQLNSDWHTKTPA